VVEDYWVPGAQVNAKTRERLEQLLALPRMFAVNTVSYFSKLEFKKCGCILRCTSNDDVLMKNEGGRATKKKKKKSEVNTSREKAGTHGSPTKIKTQSTRKHSCKNVSISIHQVGFWHLQEPILGHTERSSHQVENGKATPGVEQWRQTLTSSRTRAETDANNFCDEDIWAQVRE
jgi:hypothetical protein